MPVEIRVPPMGESVVEATILRWLKSVGDTVIAGEDLVELETDKVNNAVPADVSGVLQEVLHKDGEIVRVNEVLAVIEPSDGSEALGAVIDTGDNGRAKPTPLAARIAGEKGVDLSSVAGSGAGGRIVRADVERLAQLPTVNPVRPPEAIPARVAGVAREASNSSLPFIPPTAIAQERREERIPMTRTRSAIADRLKEAQNNAAMLTTFNEVDMSSILNLRKRRNEAFEKRYGIKLGFMSFFTKAVVGALKVFPNLNAEVQGREIILKHYYDIGIAVGAPEGLVVPVVRSADKKTFPDIEKEIRALAERARQKQLSIAELMGGTFTITNGGIYGSLMSTPILNYPQVGILGMHKMQDRAVVVDGQVVVRPMMYVALSYDHRIVDGSDAVQFLVRVKELVEDPESLLLEG